MKKIYISPAIELLAATTTNIIAGSTLDPTDTNPSGTVTDEEFHGVFGTKDDQGWSEIWD